MSTDFDHVQQSLLEPDCEAGVAEYGGPEQQLGVAEYGGPEQQLGTADFDNEEPPRPINWNLLSADEAMAEWTDLDAWVDWLRLTYGLPPTVIPPYWHRQDELVWELSALHLHWLNAYDSEAHRPAPSGGTATRRGTQSAAGVGLDRWLPSRP